MPNDFNFFLYNFFWIAIAIGGITAISTAVLGNFIVASRQSMISPMLSHTALAGVGIGIFFQFSPLWGAIGVSILTSFLLWGMALTKKTPEAISVLLLSGGVALALLFAHLSPNNPIAFENFLFGSLLTVSPEEIQFTLFFHTLLLLGIFFLWKPLLRVVFDREFSTTQSKKTPFIELFFFLSVALTVAFSLQIIGGLLVGALFVISTLSAQNFSHSFLQNTLISIAFNLGGVFSGIICSFYFDIPTSSAIVLSLIILFLCSLIKNKT